MFRSPETRAFLCRREFHYRHQDNLSRASLTNRGVDGEMLRVCTDPTLRHQVSSRHKVNKTLWRSHGSSRLHMRRHTLNNRPKRRPKRKHKLRLKPKLRLNMHRRRQHSNKRNNSNKHRRNNSKWHNRVSINCRLRLHILMVQVLKDLAGWQQVLDLTHPALEESEVRDLLNSTMPSVM